MKALTQIKTKNELIGEIIGLLQSPIQRVLGALENKDNAKKEEAAPAEPVVAVEAAAPVAEAPAAETSEEAPSAEAAPEA